METLGVELKWDPSRSNWKRYQRHYVRPIIIEALARAIEGLNSFDIEGVEQITLFRGLRADKSFAVVVEDSTTSCELYLPVNDIHHRKLGRHVNFWSQSIFHEDMHCFRNRYFSQFTLLEQGISEALAYCGTELFANKFGYEDEFDAPMDYLRTLPKSDLRALRKDVFEADRFLGVVPESDMGEGSDYDYWVCGPEVGPYSAVEAVGICAVAAQLDRGRHIADLMPLPAEEILEAA